MKKAALGFLLFILLAVNNVSATTLTWDSNSDYGLIASFTITPDVVFTDFNKKVEITASEYTFMLGDYSHEPTEGVIATLIPHFGTSIFLSDYGGWLPNYSTGKWEYLEPVLSIELADFPRGYVEINHQSDPIDLHSFGSGTFYTEYRYNTSRSLIWGDNVLTLPYLYNFGSSFPGLYSPRDVGHWDFTGITFPTMPPKPTGALPSLPEPTTMLLLGLGLIGLAGMRRKMQR